MTRKQSAEDLEHDNVKELRNEDPLSGEAGAHPAGAGIGTAVGGAATGALAGAVGGPAGTVVGAVVGGIAGGIAGKAIAERIDPTVEIEYWRNEYRSRPYYNDSYTFEDYASAYRAGWESYDPDTATEWSEREALARQRWENEGGHPPMSWDEARLAAEDAYTRATSQSPKKPR